MGKIIKIITFISIVSVFTDAYASVNTETDTLGSTIISLNLEKPYHIQTINDYCGKALIISFPDQASIILTNGNLFEFPPDKYIPEYKKYKKNRIIRGGKINNCHWRIDKFKSLKIYYLNVLENKKTKYDTILNNVIINTLTK